jgi:hypothetical protein
VGFWRPEPGCLERAALAQYGINEVNVFRHGSSEQSWPVGFWWDGPGAARSAHVRGKLKRDLRGGLKRDPPGRGRGRSPRSSLPPSKKIEESESLPGGRSERRAAARWVRPSGRAGSKSHFATVSTRYGGRGAGAKLGLTSDRRPAHDDVRAPRRNCVTLRTTRESSSARAAWRA